MSLLAELRRRNVVRVLLAWLALSWLLLAVAGLLFPAYGFPASATKALLAGLLLATMPVLAFAWRYELTPDGLRVDRGPQGDNPENTRTGRRIDQLTIVLVLLALGLSAFRQLVLPQQLPAPAPVASPVLPAPVPAAAEPAVVAEPHSVAVLPFANLSPDPANAYFADGMAEEILIALARTPGLRVASRTSSFAMQGRHLGAREIGRQLAVAHVLDGSVRRVGEQVRISAQLVRAGDDLTLWSGSFDADTGDLFAVQERIAQAIVDALAAPLGVSTVSVRRATGNLVAYERYLRGRQLFAQRGDNLRPARTLLEEAVALDPGFAEAWALLAGIHLVAPTYFAEADAGTAFVAAGDAAARALALVPGQPDALAVGARLAAERGEWALALRQLDQALAADPNNANTWLWAGLTRLETGHVGAARERFAQAHRLDPLSGIHLGWLGVTQAIEGEGDAGDQRLQQAHALGWRGAASLWRLKLALADGAGAEAGARYQDWLRDDGRIAEAQRDLHRQLAPALADPGLRPAARARLLAAASKWPGQDWTTLWLLLGFADEAAEEALRPKPASGQLLFATVWSAADRPFRQHPGFFALARQRGLLAYWQAEGFPDQCQPGRAAPPALACTR